MLEEITNATKQAQDLWKANKAPIQVKSIINQLTLDTQHSMDDGYWDFAVKLSYYRHEIAKVYNDLSWYEPFIEIRKTRDLITLLVETPNDRTEKDRTQKTTDGKNVSKL